MKKLLSVFLAVLLIITAMPLGAFEFKASAASSGTTGNCTWTLDGTVLTISGNGKMADYSVTSYGYSTAPWDEKTLTNVIIENSVTSIGKYAFYEGYSLTSVTIPNSVTSIGDYAFFDCDSLTSVTIPDSVTSIGSYAFAYSDSLTSITIGDSVTRIGYRAFLSCTSLTSVIIGNSVTRIASDAFDNCERLTSVTIPDSVTSIDNNAFSDCDAIIRCYKGSYAANYCERNGKTYVYIDGTDEESIFSGKVGKVSWSLDKRTGVLQLTGNGAMIDFSDFNPPWYDYRAYITSVEISSGITSIGFRAFSSCHNLTSVTIGDSVTSIGSNAFSSCYSLTSITIGDSVTSIASHAFSNCYSLTSITIPDSVTSIDECAFWGCYSLTSITLPFVGSSRTANETYDAVFGYIFGNYYSGDSSENIEQYYSEDSKVCYWIPSSLKSVTITDDTTIPYGAFYFCRSLTSITIPDSVTSIGDYAFYKCSNLTSITIPDSVTSIGGSAFSGCDSLENVYITDIAAWCNISFSNVSSNPLYEIYSNLLYYAKNLYLNGELVTDLIIPNGVTTIKSYAFRGCTSLKSVTIPDSVTSIGNSTFYNCRSLTSITIPDSVTSIGGSAFSDCTSLTSITIPDSVTSIGGSAFSDCTRLKSVTIGGSVTSIGNGAFYNCSSLTSITIPDSVTSIGASAFYGCTSLTSITIPDSVTSIGDYAFQDCDSLKNVYITDIAAWCNISFSSSTSIPLCYGANLYLNGELVTDLIIPNGVTTIKSGAFYGCKSLASITIGNSVTSIGGSAFSDCTSLESVTIGDSVISIGGSAFKDCSSLTSVTIGNSVTSIGSYAFSGCTSLTSITIPDSVTSIGSYAFDSCSSLANVYITDIAAWCNISFSTSDINPLNFGAKLYLNGELVTDLIIPNCVTTIKPYAFSGCTSLTSVTIPNSVTSIGSSAFYKCTSLRSVEVYNPNLSFNNYCGINYNQIIYGYVGSTAEAFAEKVGAEFIDIETVHTHTFSAATCTKPKTCVCGKTEGEALGHNYTAACDEDCNVCGEVRSASNHVYDNACDTTCNECNKIREVGPHFVGDYAEPHSLTNSASYPFSLSSGWYTSTNKANNSSSTFTLKAKHNCALVINYKVSSEAKYDNFVIKLNSTTLKTLSGSVSETSFTVNLQEGDVLTFTYSKDSSSSSGSDNASFKIEDCSCNTGVNAEDIEPTCAAPVICSGCGIIVKPASNLHTYDSDCDAECNECGKERTPPHDYVWVVDNENNCGVDGFKHEECTVCHATQNENTVITATGNHTFEWIIDKQNNCGVDGFKHEECTVCHATQNENTVIAATGNHTFEWIIDKQNNCGVDGFKHEECTVCHATQNENTVIAATGNHTFVWIIDKQNNCGVDGFKHEECTVCHATQNENTVITATGNHTYDNACDTECNECGMTRTVPDHVYDNTCDAKCNVCFGERTVPEHNFNADRVCTECGKVDYVLGDVDGSEEVTDADAEYLLMFTFFPEDYPLNN